MNRLERSPLHGSVVALALTALALLVSLLLRPYLEPDICLLFLVAVWLSAWYYGRAIGMVAAGASALALFGFFFSGDHRVLGAGCAAGVVPGDRGRDRLDDGGMAREPSRAGLHTGGHRRRGAGHR